MPPPAVPLSLLSFKDSVTSSSWNSLGTLPDAWSMLTKLAQMDVGGNQLTGSVPSSWASLPNLQLDISGNPMCGPLPKLQTPVIYDNTYSTTC
eukprot:gene6327-2951_t